MLNTGDAFDKPTYDILKGDLEFLKGDPWTIPALTNGWGHNGAPYDAGQYRVCGDFLVMKGAVKSGANGTSIFTLPVAARPSASRIVVVACASGLAQLAVSATTGTVIPSQIVGTVNPFCALDAVIPLT